MSRDIKIWKRSTMTAKSLNTLPIPYIYKELKVKISKFEQENEVRKSICEKVFD